MKECSIEKPLQELDLNRKYLLCQKCGETIDNKNETKIKVTKEYLSPSVSHKTVSSNKENDLGKFTLDATSPDHCFFTFKKPVKQTNTDVSTLHDTLVFPTKVANHIASQISFSIVEKSEDFENNSIFDCTEIRDIPQGAESCFAMTKSSIVNIKDFCGSKIESQTSKTVDPDSIETKPPAFNSNAISAPRVTDCSFHPSISHTSVTLSHSTQNLTALSAKETPTISVTKPDLKPSNDDECRDMLLGTKCAINNPTENKNKVPNQIIYETLPTQESMYTFADTTLPVDCDEEKSSACEFRFIQKLDKSEATILFFLDFRTSLFCLKNLSLCFSFLL